MSECRQCGIKLRPELVKHGYCLQHINHHKCASCFRMISGGNTCTLCRPPAPLPWRRCIDCDAASFGLRCDQCDEIERKGTECVECAETFVPKHRNEDKCKACWNEEMARDFQKEMSKPSMCRRCGTEFPPLVGWDKFCTPCSGKLGMKKGVPRDRAVPAAPLRGPPKGEKQESSAQNKGADEVEDRFTSVPTRHGLV